MTHRLRISHQQIFAYTFAIAAVVVSTVLWTFIASRGAPAMYGAAGSGGIEIESQYLLEIPRLDLRAPVQLPSRIYWDDRKWDLLEEQMQDALANGLVAYPNSTKPGEQGNIIIAGHSSPPDERARLSEYGDVFASLPLLTVGNVIYIFDEEGRKIAYEVESTDIIEATQTEVLSQETDDTRLTLITCYPIGTTKLRFVVHARKAE